MRERLSSRSPGNPSPCDLDALLAEQPPSGFASSRATHERNAGVDPQALASRPKPGGDFDAPCLPLDDCGELSALPAVAASVADSVASIPHLSVGVVPAS